MPIFVLRNAKVGIDNIDLSDHVQSVAVEMSAAEISTTAMGAGGQQRVAGIRDDRFTFTMFSDFTTGKVHDTINTKFAAAGTVEVKVLASGSTAGTSNPMFIGYCPVLTYNPVSGNVGDASMTPITLPVSGTITVATGGTFP